MISFNYNIKTMILSQGILLQVYLMFCCVFSKLEEPAPKAGQVATVGEGELLTDMDGVYENLKLHI